MKCDRCGREVSADDSYQHLGKTLCEDCYIDIRYPAKACDPWTVYTATRSRETLGLKDRTEDIITRIVRLKEQQWQS